LRGQRALFLYLDNSEGVTQMIVTPPEILGGMTLPVVQVIAGNLAEGWEDSVKACWFHGMKIPTQYDKFGDPNSRDIALMLTVLDPLSEPRLHRDMPGGFEDLENYRREVVDGVHDHWIDPAAGKWQYTYHERLFSYHVPGVAEPINQIDRVIDVLAETEYSRRANVITWKPWEDLGIGDPACLQSFWFRIVGDSLVMRCRIRSNDAYKAAMMNMYAFVDLQRIVAERLSEKLGREIHVGQYDHCADSFHIYGSYFEEFTKRFLDNLEKRTFEQRVYRTDDPTIAEIMAEVRESVQKKLEAEKEKGEN